MVDVVTDACTAHGASAMRVRAGGGSFCVRCAESAQEAARRLETAQDRGAMNKARQRRVAPRGKRLRVTWEGRTLGVVDSIVGDRVAYRSHIGYQAHVSLAVPWVGLVDERDPNQRPRDRR